PHGPGPDRGGTSQDVPCIPAGGGLPAAPVRERSGMIKPERIEPVDPASLEGLLARIKPVVSSEDYALVAKVVGSLVWLTRLVRERGTTVSRLRRLVGFSGSEKTAAVLDAETSGRREPPEDPDGAGGGSGGERGRGPASSEPTPAATSAATGASGKAKLKGHG